MDNSRSLEALYQDGTGMVSLPKKSYKASIEGYDGFDDVLSAEMAKSEENLAFLDAFQMVETKNAADKVKMLKKISTVYGSRSGMPAAAAASIESLCRVQSLEEAEKAEATGVNTGNEKAAESPAVAEKKAGFFKTVFGAIRKFFEKIWQFFMKIVSKVGSLFKKKQAATTADETGNVDVNANNSNDTNSDSSASAGAADIRNRQANSKTKLNLDYITNSMALDVSKFNPAGVKKFVAEYTKTSKAVNGFASKLRSASTVKDLKDKDGNKISDGNGGFKKEDVSVANGRRNELMEKEGKDLIDTIDATSSIVKGVADRRTAMTGRGTAESIKKALDSANKELTFEKGSDNAYTIMASLFGMPRDKKLEALAKESAKSGGPDKKASNYLIECAARAAKMKEHVVNTIQETPKNLKNPHDVMVRVCSEFEKNINSYTSTLGKNSASEFYTNLAVMASALKVCTKMEQVVVKSTSVLITYMNAF